MTDLIFYLLISGDYNRLQSPGSKTFITATSSSSDSIFTDPQITPLGCGFTTEINQCYYSEENVCDALDDEEALKSALASRNYPRVPLNFGPKRGTQNLSISKTEYLELLGDCEELEVQLESDESEVDDDNRIEDIEADMPFNFRNKIQPLISDLIGGNGGSTSNNNDKDDKLPADRSIFNISHVKKIELTEINSKSSAATAAATIVSPCVLESAAGVTSKCHVTAYLACSISII